jgi:lipopolysaccharide/colanic/teichoic acid biosynthesis glycosyltransferase
MKRAFDVAASLVALAVLALPMLFVAVCVRLGSRGPALHHATRAGRGGRPFRLHKFRTMTDGAAGPAITAADDPRVTRLGRFLRRTRVDELPQLWNVLAGDMSLVGPRPEDPRFVDAGDPAWHRVLSVRPGLTGAAQLEFAGREETLVGAADPERGYRDRVLPAKLRADAAYVDGRTFGGDLALLARTALLVVAGKR